VYSKILLINPFGIGDVLFTTPIIHTLKDAFPAIKIGYLCNRRTEPILRNNPFLDYIFVYERDEFKGLRKKSFFLWLKKMVSFLNSIKKEHFDLSLDFSLNTQYGFFARWAGIRSRIGYDFKKRGWFLTKRISLSGYSQKHIVEYYADLLKYLGLDLKYSNLELYVTEEDKKYIQNILAGEGIKEGGSLIGIFPGAGRSWGREAKLKHWPAENFAKLADKIVENYQAKIIIMGDFFEDKLAKEVTSHMHSKAIDFTGKTTIGQLAGLLSKMRLVITNDGGPLHMAVAMGVKTVSIFGPVNEKVYGPYPPSPEHIVIKKDISCRPCYQQFRMPECKRNRECLINISVDEVCEAIRRLW
jgi:lipopolysaccharide heptosyltransferase II